MRDANYERLVELLEESELAAAVVDCLLAAADGEEALSAHLAGAPVTEHALAPEESAGRPRAYLEEIAVVGFRGVGPLARLQFDPSPGLTLVVGRNGCGKSSFAEGLEVLLTGAMLRLAGRTQVWKEGWRNLHQSSQSMVRARFRLDGEREPVEVSMSWPDGRKLEEGEQRVSGARASWAELGWEAPLAQYRPILSYSELGTMFSTRAAELYEALSAVLGLEEFDAMAAGLRQVRLGRERSEKDEKVARAKLRADLADADDPRAVEIAARLARRSIDAEEIAELAGEHEERADLRGLRALAVLELPEEQEIAGAFAEARRLDARLEELGQTDAERIDALAELIQAGLGFQHSHGDELPADCPLCGAQGTIDEGWVLRAQAEAEELNRQSRSFRETRTSRTAAIGAVRGLFAIDERALLDGATAGLDTAHASEALGRWRDLVVADDRSLLADAESVAQRLREQLEALRSAAEQEEQRRTDAWRPVRDQIVGWVTLARQAARDREIVPTLKTGEKWLAEAMVTLRRERLAPVVEGARANWAELRHESNVALGEVELRRSGTQRFAAFDVAIDGAGASAFGVMSQGELSALAISVFLPRAMLPGSPFGFMLIDDPVQSMDPAKVDGLARVLARASGERQVIVFTHDERLPEAIRRLGLDARIMRVQRRARSKLEVVASVPPSDRYIGEAFAIAKGEDLPEEVKARVIPGFCRSAIEAACETRIRRRLISQGVPYSQIDEQLAGLESLSAFLAGVFELSLGQGREIAARVERLGGREAVAIVDLARRGAHQRLEIDAEELVRGARKLVRAIEA